MIEFKRSWIKLFKGFVIYRKTIKDISDVIIIYKALDFMLYLNLIIIQEIKIIQIINNKNPPFINVTEKIIRESTTILYHKRWKK